MSDNNVHSVLALTDPSKVWLGVRTLCIALLLTAAPSAIAKADCGASPGNPNDLLISFLAANNTQAAPALLHASTVEEGMLVYDDTDNVLKLCDGTDWVEVGDGGLAAHGVAGAVQFSDGSAGLLSDDANLHWDDTNNRLGIGTAAPGARLDIRDGSVGVMLAGNSPVFGTSIDFTAAGGWAREYGFTYNGSKVGSFGFVGAGATPGYLYLNANQAGNFTGHASPSVVVLASGNVGIGTTTPRSKLHVAGGIQLADDTATCPGASDIKLGTLRFNGADLQLCKSGGWSAIGAGGGATAAGAVPGAVQFRGSTAVLSADDVNLVWDDTNNRLGIGTATPVLPLHVYTGTGAELTDGTGYVLIGDQDAPNLVLDDNEIQARDNAAAAMLRLQHKGGDLSLVQGGGKVGVGTTTPAYGFDVNVSSTNYVARFMNTNTASGTDGIIVQAGPTSAVTSGTNFVRFRDGDGTDIGSIDGNGAGVTYNTASDRRVKEHIQDTHRGLDDLMRVRVRDYHMRSNPAGPLLTGYIAQELYEVFPDAVSKPNDDEGLWAVDYGRMTPLIVKAVQDLKAANDDLKAANDNLRAELREVTINQRFEIETLRQEVRALRANR